MEYSLSEMCPALREGVISGLCRTRRPDKEEELGPGRLQEKVSLRRGNVPFPNNMVREAAECMPLH